MYSLQLSKLYSTSTLSTHTLTKPDYLSYYDPLFYIKLHYPLVCDFEYCILWCIFDNAFNLKSH